MIAILIFFSMGVFSTVPTLKHNALQECIAKAMQDSSGYEVDESEALEYCQGRS